MIPGVLNAVIGSRIGRIILAALGMLAAGTLIVGRIVRRTEKRRDRDDEIKRLRAAEHTRERIQNADRSTGDADADREWLLRRGGAGGD